LEALDRGGSWCGETHVQKCAFFLQEALGVPLGVEFVLYKHGPFSFDLRQLLGEMRGNLLIDAKVREYPYGPTLVASESGRAYLERHWNVVARHGKEIRFVAERLGRRPVAELERLGTALLVKRAKPNLDARGRAAKMAELKPHINPEQARQAVEEVEQLLVEAA